MLVTARGVRPASKFSLVHGSSARAGAHPSAATHIQVTTIRRKPEASVE